MNGPWSHPEIILAMFGDQPLIWIYMDLTVELHELWNNKAIKTRVLFCGNHACTSPIQFIH